MQFQNKSIVVTGAGSGLGLAAASPTDVASLVLYAVSDEARVAHGAILCADGGTTAD